ncbi:type IVB pilus formation R64 PilN family outer membrane protein [Kerstersia gyiorum]|uniref:Type IVB pilus formation R64 PilN family outer membrane protein n=1 Tax=Kerstersia gyiorum TaxID=206506 RepID=A0A4Q7MQH0_9BURK|nr:hypothetical protein [Kerstersia gyiorum]KAB0543611.1 hypothetical protein F7P85_07015 [Kerstersia gyiorum]MCR4159856.1 hypothetical protein [Kerstersia gyiorum]RZS70021.1 type IVB pilus formation R64 PilN family outer membrane protein [Kerstersia gyiorum]
MNRRQHRAWPAAGHGIRQLALLLPLAGAVTGCSMTPALQQVDASVAAGEAVQTRHAQAFRESFDPAARQAAQLVGKPWLAGPAQPLARDAILPPALRGDIDTTLLFTPERGSLTLLGERIYRATGIPVRIAPEALLPAASFLPRLAVDGGPQADAELAPELPSGPRPLPQLLDALAHRLNLSWRYADGAIIFFRTESRVFDVRLLTLDASTDVRLGRSSSSETDGFKSEAETTLALRGEDAMAALKARLEPMLTRAGVLAAVPGGGQSVVVTDTPEALDRVARFLEQENRALTRRIKLVFEEITVELDDEHRQGLDWSLLYAGGGALLHAAMPGGLAATDAGGQTGASLQRGGLQGSRAILDAVKRAGKVVRHTRVPIYTLNRRPVTHAVRRTFSYIDEVQTTAVAAAGSGGTAVSLPSVSISQKEATVGVFLTLLPDAQANGQILLSVAYDNSVAQPLQSVTFGEAGQQVQIQQITVDGNGAVQQVALRPGQVMVISGFERNEDESSSRRVAPGWPLAAGGQDQAAQRRRTTLLLVSAQQEEGF